LFIFEVWGVGVVYFQAASLCAKNEYWLVVAIVIGQYAKKLITLIKFIMNIHEEVN
jgi:hypothetical protein